MNRPKVPQILPAIMGALRQERSEGTLTLEQNDGIRRLFWANGELIHLQSDVAGEQFGNYLLRQGILDFPALSELLANEEHFRLGEKVVQWGLMSLEELDLYLKSLQEQVMIHALEHSIISIDWKAELVNARLSEDLHFRLQHRHFVWTTFHEAHNIGDLCDLLYTESKWRWVAPSDLLHTLSDLPLTPKVAYTLSFLGAEPISFETFLSISDFNEEDGARLLMTLWALGGLSLVQGDLPHIKNILSPSSPLPSSPQDVRAQEPVPMPLPHMPIPTLLAPNKPLAPPSLPLQQPPPQPSAPTPTTMPPLALDFTTPSELSKIPMDTTIPSMPEAVELAPEEDRFAEPPGQRARKFLLKAKNLLIQDRTVEAIRLLEQSVKLDPDSDQAYEPWLLLGKHRMTNPAWSTRAIEALQSASRLRPKAAEPWALMGDLYHRKNFRANSRACFKKALELDPSVPIPPDINLKEEDVPQDERPGILRKLKSILGRQEKE